MTDENTTNAAVDTKAVDNAAADNQNSETLDDILNSVDNDLNSTDSTANPASSRTDTDTGGSQDDTVTVSRQEFDELKSTYLADKQASVQNQVQADINSAVDAVSGIASHVDKELIEGLLYARADKDPRFNAAFENRQKDPATWNKVLTKVGEELGSKVPVDPKLKDNQDALENLSNPNMAVMSEDTQKWDEMSDGAFMDNFNDLAQGDGYS